MEKHWHDRATRAFENLRQRREADKETFHEIWKYLNQPDSARDGEMLVREGNGAGLLLKGEPVFSFFVEDGVIAIRGNGEANFTDREKAYDHMANLLALVDERQRRKAKG